MASALALRAKVRTPSRHLFPPDFCAADVAGLPGPAEDLHLQLMPAFAPTRIEIVAEARAAVAQGKLERLPDRLMQQLDAAPRQRVRSSLRADAGDKQRLIGIYVSDAGDGLLIEQSAFYGARPPLEEGVEVGRRELFAEWLRAELRPHERLIVDQPHRPELAQVHKAEPRAIVEAEGRAQVGRLSAGARIVEEAPRHAQVDAPGQPVVQPEQKVLAAALDILDAPPGDLPAELVRWKELDEPRRVRGDQGFGYRAAYNDRQQIAADGLDFREFGHGLGRGEFFDARRLAVLHLAPVAAGLRVDLQRHLHVERLWHDLEAEAAHVFELFAGALEDQLVVDLKDHQAAHFAVLHLGVEAVDRDVDDVRGRALHRHVDGGAIGGVADVEVRRVDLRDVETSAEQVLDVAVLP